MILETLDEGDDEQTESEARPPKQIKPEEGVLNFVNAFTSQELERNVTSCLPLETSDHDAAHLPKLDKQSLLSFVM